MQVPTMAELTAKGEIPDILFWVGCAGSYDQRAQRITKAFAAIQQKCAPHNSSVITAGGEVAGLCIKYVSVLLLPC